MKRSVSILFVLALSLNCFGQSYTLRFDWKKNRKEILFGAGANNFLGDLGGANQVGTNGIRDFDFPAVRPNFNVGYRYRISENTAVKTNLIYGILFGNDQFTSESFRQNRNCNFKSPLIELSTQFEFCIVREREGRKKHWLPFPGWRYIQQTTYFFTGIGMIYFNPKGEYNGKWYSLRPLCTEGEGFIPTRTKYAPVQIVIPFGLGFKFALSENWSVGIEYGIRKTFTDYMDDVSKTYVDPDILFHEKGPVAVHFADPSLGTIPGQTQAGQQRGDPTDKDSFMFSFFSFYYKIPKHRSAYPKFR